MFSILVVEDDRSTYQRLASRLPRHIPEARVEVVMTVDDARQRLLEARNKREPYDAIILDIKLPKSKGEHPEMDETLCDTIKELMPSSTIVAHISAYLDDEEVIMHMKTRHDEQIDRAFRLSKMDVEWNLKLERKLRSFLYGGQIEQQMDQLFGRDGEPSFTVRNRPGRAHTTDDRSVTHLLSALSRDIATHWGDLDDGLRARVQRTFEVTTKDDKTIVSFF